MLENIQLLGSSITLEDQIFDYLSISKLNRSKAILSILVDNKSYLNIIHQDVKLEPEYIKKYLYSAGSSNGPDKTPISLITDIEKTFNKKIMKWFDKYNSTNQFFYDIGNILRQNSDRIIQDLKTEIKNISKDDEKNILLTIKIRQNNEDKFIGEYEPVINILKSHYETATDTIQENQIQIKAICLFCKQEKELLPDNLSTSKIFSFATFDKKGFLYDFHETNKNNQIPICKDCFLQLKRGKEWLDKYCYFDFESYKYYLIPSINSYKTNKNDFEEFINTAETYSLGNSISQKETKLRYENSLMKEEEDLLDDIVTRGIILTLEFLFVNLKGGGKYMDIKRYINDVPLTWIKKLYDCFNDVLTNQFFNEENMQLLIRQKWEGPLKSQKGMYFASLIRQFFPIGSLDMEFLEVISRILSGNTLNSNVLLRSFLRVIRKEISKNYGYAKLLGIKSMVLLITLKRLKLIINISNHEYMNSTMTTMDSTANDNDDGHDVNKSKIFSEILDSDGKKAVFYEGVLVGKLLAIQYANRNSTPFIDNLHGLHISFSRAKYLLRKIISKLRDYQAAYPEIENSIANHFILAEKDKKSLSDDESSYYFTLGMLLHSSISKKID